MKCLINESTEERIKAAAAKIFMEKGFDGTTTRDIAKEAGLNSALMNYYFRSKEKLFAGVFSEMCELFFQGMTEILSKELSFKDKILALIDHDFKIFRENPALSNFILNELHRNPDRLLDITKKATEFRNSVIVQQFNEAVAAGEVREIDINHILLLIPSNVQFVFISKPMTMKMHNMTESDFDIFIDNHIKFVKEMIADFLFLK
jgi:AcrR family transcriptional regulator